MNIGIEDPQAVYRNFDYQKSISVLKNRSSQSAMEGKTTVVRDEKLHNACVEFESIFIKQMLNAMKKNVEKSGLIEGGMAEDIFDDMLYDEYALVMAKNSHFGLADMIYRQLTPQDAGMIGASVS